MELRLVETLPEDQDPATADEMQPSPSVSLSPLASSTPSSPLPIPSSPTSPSSMSPLPPPPQAQRVRRSAHRQRRCVPYTEYMQHNAQEAQAVIRRCSASARSVRRRIVWKNDLRRSVDDRPSACVRLRLFSSACATIGTHLRVLAGHLCAALDWGLGDHLKACGRVCAGSQRKTRRY